MQNLASYWQREIYLRDLRLVFNDIGFFDVLLGKSTVDRHSNYCQLGDDVTDRLART